MTPEDFRSAIELIVGGSAIVGLVLYLTRARQ